MEKIFSWTLDIMLILFSILFLSFTLLASKNYHFDTKIIEEYRENWGLGPILEIISTNGRHCPEGYEPFITNSFPGSMEGCNCLNSEELSTKGKIFEEKCDQYKIADGCKEVFNTTETNLTTWRGSNLCVLRMNKNFWQLTATNTKCTRGMKRCGILDSFNNSLCVFPNEKCPVNDILILSSDDQAPDWSYTSIVLNDGFILYYTNKKQDSPIIVEVEAREHPVCVHPFEGNLGENNYVLNSLKGEDNCITPINNTIIDDRFILLDQENEYNLLTENGILPKIKKLPNYPMPKSDDKVFLYELTYFGWNKQCFNDNQFTQNKLVTPQLKVDAYANKAYTLALIALVHFVFVLMSIILYKMIFEKLRVSMTIVFVIDCINIIFLITMIVFIISLLEGTGEILAPFTNFINKRCGDNITDGVMSLAFDEITSVKGFLIPLLVLGSIEIAYIIGYYIWMCATKKEEFRYSHVPE